MAKKPKRSVEDAELEQIIERTYYHPTLSPWHVREELRLIHLRLMKLEAKNCDSSTSDS